MKNSKHLLLISFIALLFSITQAQCQATLFEVKEASTSLFSVDDNGSYTYKGTVINGYAEMWFNWFNQSFSVPQGGVWYILNVFNNSTNLSGFSYAASTLTVNPGAAGMYGVVVSLTGRSLTGTDEFMEASITVNNIVQPQIIMRRKFSKTDLGNGVLRGIVELNEGDEVNVVLRADRPLSSAKVKHGCIVLFKL